MISNDLIKIKKFIDIQSYIQFEKVNQKFIGMACTLNNGVLIKVKAETFGDAICKLEEALDGDLSNMTKETIKRFNGIEWLINKDLKLSLYSNGGISKNLIAEIYTDDQCSLERNMNLFTAETDYENSCLSVLNQCNSWAEALKRHIESQKNEEMI